MEETLSRREAGKQIPENWSRLVASCSSCNKEDAVIGLLCLQDGFDNLVGEILSRSLVGDNLTSDLRAMVFRDLGQWVILIDRVLDMTLHLGLSGPRQVHEQPKVQVSLGETLDLIAADLIRKGNLGRRDATIPILIRMAGSRQIAMMVTLEGAKGTAQEVLMNRLVDLVLMAFRYDIFLMSARRGYSINVSKGKIVPRVNYPQSMTPLKIMSLDRTDPRSMHAESIWAAEWSSTFGENMEATQATANLGMDNPVHRKAFEIEQKAFFEGYNRFPGFPDRFASEFGYTIFDFDKVARALQNLARPRGLHMVYVDLQEKLLRDVSKSTGLPRQIVAKVVQSLLWREGVSTKYCPITPLGLRYVFSFRQIMIVIGRRLEGYFRSVYDDVNMKGEVFEDVCRKVLLRQDFRIHPVRLEISHPILSEADSLALWNYVKRGSDFDVLGSKGRFMVVAECKERKRNFGSRINLPRLFATYHRENVLKTNWLAGNLEVLSGSPCIEAISSVRPRYAVPLIVCNLLIPELELTVPLITFRELTFFLAKFDFNSLPDANGFINIPISPETNLPVEVVVLP